MSDGSTSRGRGPGEDPVAPPSRNEGPSSAATPSRPGSGVIRPVPQPSDGPSFEAIAMQSVLSRARDSSRFEAPPTADGDASRGRRVPARLLVVTALVVVALGITAGAVWVNLFRDAGVDDETVVTVTQTDGALVRTPQETVRGYLGALAEGDIEKALEFGPLGGTGSEALLTPEAYGAMPEESRPRNITLGTDDPLATEIPVTYTLAGEDVSTSIRVKRTETGSYDLVRATVTIQLQVAGGDNLPVFVNGVEVQHTSPIEAVPGTYTLTTGLSFIAFPTDSSTISILTLARSKTGTFLVNPELTDAGTSALLESARTSLTRCIDAAELTPAGCPNGIRAPKPVAPGSVQWSMSGASAVWTSFSPALSPDDQTVALATLPLTFRVSMDYTDGSNSGFKDVRVNAVLSATMLGSDASAVTVEWGR
ncbi:hypothetical protein [Tessaracoccus antarcticus]|uniref:Uncharacterized protein n=1 Tax=Tessaracoccus antarcticus TaxID=2479848 RepID=A0A3M0G2A2_9ACTN|nr:hypothetical protein [Tessaracoccus antarcticus]RMB58247.1 hypothetical protein EAX62_13655 [Tessaracoccus antarcticus]